MTITITNVKIVGICSKCRKAGDKILRDVNGREYKDSEISCLYSAFTSRHSEPRSKSGEEIRENMETLNDKIKDFRNSHQNPVTWLEVEDVKKCFKKIIDKIDKITSFTCKCNSVSFIGRKCKSCGKKYSYGELDYDEVLKIIKEEVGEDLNEI